MKINRKIILPISIAIVLLAGIILLPYIFKTLKTSTNYYADVNSAISDGAVESGWLPNNIPLLATNIYEQHNTDTNDVFMRFEVKQNNWKSMTKGLRLLATSEVKQIECVSPFNVDWWFECFIEQCPSNDNGLFANVYYGGNAYLAKDKFTQVVYYWTTSQGLD